MSGDETQRDRLIYAAGLFDGEGSFCIQMNVRTRNERQSAHFNPRMSMTLKYGTEALDVFLEQFGGQLYHYKDAVRWNLGGRENLLAAARKIRPHLIIKQKIADRFIDALEAFPTERAANTFRGERSWTPEVTEKVARIALSLNPPTARKSTKNHEFLDNLAAIYQVDAHLVKEEDA